MKNSIHNINWLTQKPIAHRGLHNKSDAPENSYAAFEKAIDFGLPIELDLQLTSDNKVIVFHDEDFKRMCDSKITVEHSEWNSVKIFHLNQTDQKIPLFSELLEFVSGEVPLLIEIKNFSRPGQFEKRVLEDLNNYKGEFALQSFNPLTLRWLKINKPEILRGQISSRFKRMPLPFHYRYLLRNLTLNFSAKPDFINYNIDDLPHLPVEIYRNHGMPVLAWTVKNNEQLIKANELADNFVFEELDPFEIVNK